MTALMPFGATDMYEAFLGLPVPDPITFVLGEDWLNRPHMLYPRQGTLIKIIFARLDLFCADEQTEILTRSGWKHYWDVTPGEDVMSITPDGSSAEWVPAERVNVFDVEDEELILMDGDGHSSLTTPNHRWLSNRSRSGSRSYQFVETQDLGSIDSIPCAAPVSNLPQSPVWSDAMVELVAWYWTEGTAIVGHQGGVKIGQSHRVNPVYVERIRAALTQVFGPASDYLRGTRHPAWSEDSVGVNGMTYFRLNSAASADLKSLAVGSEKIVGPSFLVSLTQEQLDLYIETSIAADGWVGSVGNRMITQKAKARIDSFQMACSLAGLRTVMKRQDVKSGPYRGSDRWSLSIYDKRKSFSVQPKVKSRVTKSRKGFTVERVRHTGQVWCPTTKNGTWLARREGKVYFTGNTEYDHKVIDEWEENFRNTGNNGIVPGVRKRMEWLNKNGAKWFREVMLVMGRRAGKGYVSGVALAYVIWNYLSLGDPQTYYGIDRDKRISCLIFAGKRDQAKATVFADLVNAITSSTCFGRYVSKPQTESLTVYAPHDFIRMQRMREKGITTMRDMASIEILPKESTPMAGRGPSSFCLDPSTPVLKSDLTWVPIGGLSVGDRLIGFDETAEPKKQRRLRESVVQAKWNVVKTPVRLTFDDGSSVVCSLEHMWLTRDLGKGGYHRWKETRYLKVGHRIRHLRDPWYHTGSYEEGYLAGVFDGEGCISGWSDTSAQGVRRGAALTFTQNPGVVADRTKELVESMGLTYLDYSKSYSRRCRQWWLGGMTEAMEFLGRTRPVRLMDKAHLVWDGCAPRGGATPHGRVKQNSYKTITSIEQLPEQELVDITTSTRTFFANGLFSHNCLAFDEMAHVQTGSGTARSADEVYNASKPSLDQFGKDSFIIEPSSPWQMMGKFYDNVMEAQQLLDNGEPLRPNYLAIQLASWDIYKDWEIAEQIPVFPEDFEGDLGEYIDMPHPHFPKIHSPIQVYDEEMEREEQANPETFAVERKAHWAAAVDAYFNAEKVDQMFAPWEGRLGNLPKQLTQQAQGLLSISYKAHCDPSKVNDKFGYCVGHVELDSEGRWHAVIDRAGHYDPADFPDHIIDYEVVDEDIWNTIIVPFMPDELTFDQYSSGPSIQKFSKRIRDRGFPKRINVGEKTATRPYDWSVKENTKAALNMGLVHCPPNDRLRDEMRFAQLKNGRVDHPDSGPVQSKDIMDCLCEVVSVLIGEQTNALIHGDLERTIIPVTTGMPQPFPQMSADPDEAIKDMLRGSLGAGRSARLDPSNGGIWRNRGNR